MSISVRRFPYLSTLWPSGPEAQPVCASLCVGFVVTVMCYLGKVLTWNLGPNQTLSVFCDGDQECWSCLQGVEGAQESSPFVVCRVRAAAL